MKNKDKNTLMSKPLILGIKQTTFLLNVSLTKYLQFKAKAGVIWKHLKTNMKKPINDLYIFP